MAKLTTRSETTTRARLTVPRHELVALLAGAGKLPRRAVQRDLPTFSYDLDGEELVACWDERASEDAEEEV